MDQIKQPTLIISMHVIKYLKSSTKRLNYMKELQRIINSNVCAYNLFRHIIFIIIINYNHNNSIVKETINQYLNLT